MHGFLLTMNATLHSMKAIPKGDKVIYLVCCEKNTIHGPKGSITLTKKEMALFLELINNKKDIDEIINHIWTGRAEVINQNTLSQLAFRLRNKLRQASVPLFFTLSMLNGVNIQKSCRCAFVTIHKKPVAAMLTRVLRILGFAWARNNATSI